MEYLGFRKLIGIASSPNATAIDLWVALKMLFKPFKWLDGAELAELEEWFKSYFKADEAVTFESGRTALYQILKAYDIGEGDEVILQAYTCVVVPDAIVWTGAKPIYVDIGGDFNINPYLVESKITPRTRAIIVQHTFGQPANLKKLSDIARRYNLKLIEDCAHTIGGKDGDKLLGTFGEAAFFSFGQEKAISSVKGGLAITSSKEIGQVLREAQQNLPYPSRLEVARRLLHPILWSVISITYYVGNLGKVLMVLARQIGLTQSLVTMEEIRGEKPSSFPKRLANAQAVQALTQLKRFEHFNKRRLEISIFYQRELGRSKLQLPPGTSAPLLRYTIQVKDPAKLQSYAKKFHIILGNWYDHVIYPKSTNLAAISYEPGSCPQAEEAAANSVNLPTYPRMTLPDAERVVSMIKSYEQKH